MSRRGTIILAVLTTAGCDPDTEVVAPSQPIGETTYLGIEVIPSLGNAPHEAIVRAVNEYGAAIASTPQSLTVAGETELVNFDGTGYGTLVLSEPGSYQVIGGVQEEWVHAVDTDWGGVAMLPAELPTTAIADTRPATGGALVINANEVWFVSGGGASPTHRVFAFPDDTRIEGLETANIDLDGVLDAIVWGGNEVILLKGRAAGGFAWNGGYRGLGLAAAGAAAADLDGDGDQDLAISWIDSIGSDRLQILHGDGLWSFADATVMSIQSAPIGGLALGDNVGSGRIQTTVLLDSGRWQRWSITGAGSYVVTGPNIATTFTPGSTVRSGRDTNADGADELYILGPKNPGFERDVWIWDLLGETVQYRRLNPVGGEVAFGDSNGDGLEDVWWVPEDRELSVMAWQGAEYQQRRVASLRSHGPIAVTEINGDGESDLFVGGASIWTWRTGVQDEEQWWRTSEPGAERWEAGLLGPIAGYEGVSGAGLVGFQGDGGSTWLSLWQADGGPPVQLGRVLLGDSSSEGVDLAVCGDTAWALTETTLFTVDLAGGSPSIIATRSTSGTRVDCGEGPSEAEGALLEGGTVVLLSAELDELGSEGISDAVDVAIGRTGGDPSVVACSEADCRIQRWVWGETGSLAMAVTNGESITLSFEDGSEVETAGWGELSTGDVDGNGHHDLIAHHDGVVVVWRSTGQGVGPSEAWHTTRALVGPVVAGDGDGDGWPDLWAGRSSGDLFQSVAPGAVPSTEE